MATRNLINGSLKILDGATPTPNELVIPLDEGNLDFEVDETAEVVMNRGSIVGFADFPERPCVISFTIKFEEWLGKTLSGANPSPQDALRKKGNAAAWVSTQLCGPYTVDLEFTIAKPSNCTDPNEQPEVLTFADFHADTHKFTEGEVYNTVAVAGKALIVAPTSVRS